MHVWQVLSYSLLSLPARGARIEIIVRSLYDVMPKSLPARGARIDIRNAGSSLLNTATSLPARGARIEIS